MPQTIALQAKHYPVDLPGIVRSAQAARDTDYKLENMPLENELERMKLQSGIGQQQALDAYRNVSRETGDPVTAMAELDGYPDLQAELYKSLDALPDSERAKAVQRTEAFGRAAQWVMSYPEGSPEQRQAWDTSLDVLLKDGYIDQRLYEQAKQSGPSKLLLNNALTVAEFAKQYTGTKAERDQAAIALTNARKTAVEAGIGRADTESQARIEQGNARVGIAKDKAGKTVRTGLGKDGTAAALRRVDDLADKGRISYGTPEYEELKAKVFAEMGIAGAPGAAAGNISQFDLMTGPQYQGGPDQAEAPQGTGKTAADAVAVATQEDFDALPPGAFFVNPADGRVMRKK